MTVRRVALLAVIASAIVSPDIALPAGLPAVRLEQLVLAALLPGMALLAVLEPRHRRLGLIDAAFATLGSAVLATLALAPLFVHGASSAPRDAFELFRVAEYWLLFRLGLSLAADERSAGAATTLLAVAAVALALFSLVQYLHPGDFNYVVTDIWTEQNNLLALERRGRVIGTVGNANYYGILSGLTLLTSLCVLLQARDIAKRTTILLPAGVVASAFSLVLAQSRTAVGAVVAGMVVLAIVVVAQRRHSLRPLATSTALAGGIAGAAIFMLVVPPRFGGLLERFDPFRLADDPAVTSRLSKWKSAFANDEPERAAPTCDSLVGSTLPPAPGHEVANPAMLSTPGEAGARDRQRKSDTLALYGALLAHRCTSGALPDTPTIESTLVPRYLATFPRDPLTGEPYRFFVHETDFLVGANLENPRDPEGPVYALGTIPNLLLNPSFEDGGSRPRDWHAVGPASVEISADSLFGAQAARVELRPGRDSGAIASMRQVVASGIVPGVQYTVAAWVRLEEREPRELRLYTVAITADGTTIEPFVKIPKTFSPGGKWEHVSISFTAPAGPPLAELRLFLLAPPDMTARATVLVDGFTLSKGWFPPSFPTVRDVSPSSVAANIDNPGFRDSPLIGVGPGQASDSMALDNEYALFLDRYGALGTLAYVGLWLAAIAVTIRVSTGSGTTSRSLGLAIAAFTAAVLGFNVAAGAYYEFQLMGIYWPLVGLAAGAARRRT